MKEGSLGEVKKNGEGRNECNERDKEREIRNLAEEGRKKRKRD